MRALKHVGLFLLCAGVVLLVAWWGAVISLSDFAVGGDVVISEQQKQSAATGDAILAVFDWPSRHLLGVRRSWVFSSVCHGAVLYAILVGLRRCLRRKAA